MSAEFCSSSLVSCSGPRSSQQQELDGAHWHCTNHKGVLEASRQLPDLMRVHATSLSQRHLEVKVDGGQLALRDELKFRVRRVRDVPNVAAHG